MLTVILIMKNFYYICNHHGEKTHVFKLHVEEGMQTPSSTKKQDLIKLGNMSNREIQVFSEKIWLGLELAEMRMLQDKALHGETVVICDSNNNIKHIPAQQVIDDHVIFQQVDTEKREELKMKNEEK